MNDPLLKKIADLALHPSSPEGEWQAAAIKYFSRLRNAGSNPGSPNGFPFRGGNKAKGSPGFDGRVPFGKYKGKTVLEVFNRDVGYIEWLLSIEIDAKLRAEIMRVARMEDEK